MQVTALLVDGRNDKPEAILQKLGNFTRLSVTPGGLFAVEQRFIDCQLESPAA
jgi:hypothetical protein